MSAASIFPTTDGRFGLRFPYSANLITDLKAQVPRWARAYNPESKVWTFDRAQLALVKRLCVHHLGAVHVDPDLEPRRPAAPTSAYDTMIRGLPFDTLKRIYWLAISAVHPDAGGDVTRAQQINAAWSAIKDEVGTSDRRRGRG